MSKHLTAWLQMKRFRRSLVIFKKSVVIYHFCETFCCNLGILSDNNSYV